MILIMYDIVRSSNHMPKNNIVNPNQNISSDWPCAFKIYSISKAAVKYNRNLIIGLMALAAFVEIAYVVYSEHSKTSFSNSAVYYLVEFILIIFQYMILYVILQGSKANKINLDQTLTVIFKKVINIIVCSFILSIIFLASIILLIIPAFFIIPRIYLAVYYVIDKDMDPISAIKTCWHDTRNNVLKLYEILGVNILILILALTIVGIPFAIYFGFYYYGASTVYYRYISSQNILELN